MRPIFSMQNKGKASFYQEYRSKAKSELNCSSDLLSGLNQIDEQMREYDKIKGLRLSQSQIELTDKNDNNFFIPLPKSANIKEKELKTDRLHPTGLTPIMEYDTKSKPTKGTITNSRGVAVGSKAVLNKGSNGLSKQKQVRKQKISHLKLKTKQLQQQFLQLLSGDLYKKSCVNKEFVTLFKLLD